MILQSYQSYMSTLEDVRAWKKMRVVKEAEYQQDGRTPEEIERLLEPLDSWFAGYEDDLVEYETRTGTQRPLEE